MNVDSHIGQYKVLRTLGAGGMGTVFLGEHLLLGRRAAIKTLLPALSSHREIVDRFFNEARAISAISDPGVVQIFDFGYHVDGTAYIVMEYLEGESLLTRIERHGRLPVVVALRIARQIAQSLGAAHASGIIHRDLKPSNVFLIRDPEAQGGERTKILDFGICKLADSDGTVTQTGTMLGTPVYMSPEQCRGNGRIDQRSDIYSLGCVLFHMLTGQPPFRCDSIGEFIAAHLKDEPPKPSELVPELSAEVDAIVLRCMEKAPEDRFQSMQELQVAIERVLVLHSDQGSFVAAPVIANTPLGEGFRSAYDVNAGEPSDSWFIDSQAPVSASPITGDWLEPKRRFGWGQRFALLLALGAGVAGGLGVTNYFIEENEKTKAAPSIPQTPAVATSEDVELAVPAAASTHETLPVEPAEPAERAQLAEEITEPPTFTRDAPAAKPIRPPRPYIKTPPRPRRAVPLEEPSEDLYDTR